MVMFVSWLYKISVLLGKKGLDFIKKMVFMNRRDKVNKTDKGSNSS